MGFGRHLRELWRSRPGVVTCLLIATFAALSTSYRISLSPPGLSERSLEMAAASTQVLVDTPTSLVLDLRQDTTDIESLTNRSVLLGNVMASPPVVAYIARRAGVPYDAIKAVTPRTPNAPRPLATENTKRSSKDLLASTQQYRLSIDANPTVPVLQIYAQAPTAQAAGELANAAVQGLRDYLRQLAETQGVVREQQVRVEQLGRAEGQLINRGVRWQFMLVTFLVAFGASAGAAIFIGRTRKGFRLEGERSPGVARPAHEDARVPTSLSA